MKVLIADQRLVTEIFPMEEAMPTMRRALTMLAKGDVVMPLRTMLGLPRGDAVMEIARERDLGTWVGDRRPALRQSRGGMTWL